MIVPTNDVGDLHHGIVHYHHVVVNRHAVRSKDDGITDYFVGKFDRSADNVVEPYGVLGNLQTYRRELSTVPAGSGLCRI